MSNVQNISNQTPIEIALGIDEGGTTTARKLYDFLGMDASHYSRWFKNNIENNQFAEENVDYFPFATNGECGGQASQDAKLTSSFAKKLSMQQKTERGEQARNYFISVEDKAKDMALLLKQSSDNPMKILKLHYAALEQVDKKVSNVGERVGTLENRFNEFEDTLPVTGADMDEIQSALKKKGVEVMGGKESNAYKDRSTRACVYFDIQCELRRQFGVKRYKEIRHKKTPDALRIVENYKLPLALKDRIESVNAQQSLDLEGGAQV